MEDLKAILKEIVMGIIDLRQSDEQLELLDYVYELAESENLTEIVDIIEDFRWNAHLCSRCGEDEIEETFFDEDRGECFGFPCSERMCKQKCGKCGWEAENQ